MLFLRAFTTPYWYVGWFLVSAAALAIAYHVHPYALAFAGLLALWICAALAITGLAASFVAGRERGYGRALIVIAYAVLSATPTLIALWVLSRIRWA